MSIRSAALSALVAAFLLWAPTAQAESFGVHDFDVTFTDAQGNTVNQAGAHPYALDGSFEVNATTSGSKEVPVEAVKDGEVQQIFGLIGDQSAVPKCSIIDFLTPEVANATGCPDSTAIGTAVTRLSEGTTPPGPAKSPIYNLAPAPGSAARIGFSVLELSVTISVGLSKDPPYRLVVHGTNVSQIVEFFGLDLTLWGVPADPRHDEERGSCYAGGASCPTGLSPRPFITMPRACSGPLATEYAFDSWQHPAPRLPSGEPDLSSPLWATGYSLTHDEAGNPQGMFGCGDLAFTPRISTEPTSHSAETGTGLDFNLDFTDEGLKSPEGRAESETKKVVVALPQGVTINPSVAEGLAVCTPAQIAAESVEYAPGTGCPEASKVGSLTAELPIAEEPVQGSVYLAQQDDPATTRHGAENPFDSLIALYFVLRNEKLGVLVKLPVLIEPDPKTGQLVVTLDDSPQFPLSHFNAHLRTGARAALITPNACGAFTTEAKLYPWSNPTVPTIATASFEIKAGVNGGPCPPGGVPPFNPGFEAGSLNNAAGSFSPFTMRLIRHDGEQDMTRFSAVLPPGELGSLAGVDKCPDTAIGAARSKTARQEIASPSCPANSLIGHTLAGAGVGDSLTYVKGYVYLGGPYHGDPLSVIAITPALAGPYDAGTVVVQEALTLNPRTAEVEVDGAASDPIPHILKGIVLKLRDLRVYVDRPDFTLNPTSCAESSAKSVLYGSYLNVLDPADDVPVDLASRFQAADCASLPFKPHLKLNLKGGTRRGGHPGLRALYTPRKGDANIKGLVVRLPRSAFLDQAHIKTICTRVQFSAGAGNGAECPKKSRYGYVKAWTPLLDEPLQGPVFLRSSSHKLPDLVFALHGLVDIEVDIRIDSAGGGIRATLQDAPDATLSRVLVRMQGGQKGLIINSRSLCARKSRANVLGTGHNGRRFHAHPLMKAQCGKHRKHKRHHRRG